METARLNEAELAKYCRAKGLFVEQVGHGTGGRVGGAERRARRKCAGATQRLPGAGNGRDQFAIEGRTVPNTGRYDSLCATGGDLVQVDHA